VGKTPVPLTIIVDSTLEPHPSLDLLVEKGHTVRFEPIEADIVLSPKAHFWHPTFWVTKYLEAALKAARARRKA
jgi:hypothetical protein